MDKYGQKIAKKINLVGLILWVFIYFSLIPYNLLKKYPLALIGFFYSFILLLTNYLLIGDRINTSEEADFNRANNLQYSNLLNDKALQIATIIFAISISSEKIFKKKILKDKYIFVILTLILGVGIILPIYFVSNFSTNTEDNIKYAILRIKNVFLNYAIGFMMSNFMISAQVFYFKNNKV